MAKKVNPPYELLLDEEFGVDRSLYFRWSWNQSNTDHFEVWWEYTTGNKTKVNGKTYDIWFTGSQSNVNAVVGISTYTYPANAERVRVRVKAVAKENDGSPYWVCDYTKAVSYKIPASVAIAGVAFRHAVSGLKITPENRSVRKLHAFWSWTKSYTDYFLVRWFYSDGTVNSKGDRIWFLGALDQVVYEGGEHQSSFTAPNEAARVTCRVRAIAKIKEETSTLIRYHWTAISTTVEYAFPKPETKKNSVTGLSVVVQNGTARTLLATWNWSHTPIDHYEVTWEYTSGEKYGSGYRWIRNDPTNVSVKQSLYTMPDNAIKARVCVRPICATTSGGFIAWTAPVSDYVESKVITAANDKQVKNLKIEVEKNAESSLIASWVWEYGYVDHYEVTWIYTTGNTYTDTDGKEKRIFSNGSKESTERNNSIFSYPENAVTVKVTVLPIAKASAWIAKSIDVTFNIADAAIKIDSVGKKISNLAINRQQGTTDTVVATWNWNVNVDTTDHYDVEWQYLIKTVVSNGLNGIWVREDTKSTSSGDDLYDIYNIPSNTEKIKVRVKPIASTHKVQNIETARWNADWSDWKEFTVDEAEAAEAIDPPTPPTPSAFVNALTLTAELDIYDEGADAIQFEVVKDDSERFRTGLTKIVFNHAEMRFPVAAGGEYKVRARSLRTGGLDDIDTIAVETTVGNSQLSPWSEYSQNVGTIPETPSKIITHNVITTEEVLLTWESVLNITGYTIEYTTNIDYFDKSEQVTSKSTGADPSYYLDGLESGNVYYARVRAVNESGESGWSPIYSFILGTQPNPPTTWSDTTRCIIGDVVYLYWTHNSEDGSSQTEAEIEITVGQETFIVAPTAMSDGSTPSYYIFNSVYNVFNALKDENNYELVDSESETIYSSTIETYGESTIASWRVRTRGVANEWSKWSTQRTIVFYANPSLILYVGNDEEHNDTAYEITHYPLRIYAEAFPKNQNAIGYYVNIVANESYESIDKYGNDISIRDQQSVFSKYYPSTNGNIFDLVLTAGDVDLDNNITYTVTVKVGMASGLSGDNSWTFTARWDDSYLVPDAEITIDKAKLCAYIRPFCENDDGDFSDNVTLTVYRTEYDGRFVEIAKDLPNGTATVVDPHPSLSYARYRVVAMNEYTGDIGFRDIPSVPVGETAIVIQWEEKWKNFNTNNGMVEGVYANSVHTGSTLKLPYNVDVSDSNDIDVALNEYIGRSHPVSYYGTQLGIKGSWNAVIPRDDMETLYGLRRLAIYRGDVYVREPSGVGYWANVNVSFSRSHSDMTIPVSLNVTRVEGGM